MNVRRLKKGTEPCWAGRSAIRRSKSTYRNDSLEIYYNITSRDAGQPSIKFYYTVIFIVLCLNWRNSNFTPWRSVLTYDRKSSIARSIVSVYEKFVEWAQSPDHQAFGDARGTGDWLNILVYLHLSPTSRWGLTFLIMAFLLLLYGVVGRTPPRLV